MKNAKQSALYAVNMLENKGYTGYLVGGCVRDMLSGVVPHDFDITTNALPDQIEKVFSEYKFFDVGKKHGTISVIIDENTLEITTYRCDGEYSDRRHPDKVTFSDNLYEDLSRRDFTINAMAYNPKTGITDFFGGAEDLKNRIVRCVGDPNVRFAEDALRMLRALRFASQKNFKIEPLTGSAIIGNLTLIDYVSGERIFAELKKLLCGVAASRVLCDYRPFFLHIFGVKGQPDPSSIAPAIKNYNRFCSMLDILPDSIVLKTAALLLAVSAYENFDSEVQFSLPREFTENAYLKSIALLKKIRADNKTVSSVSGLIRWLSLNISESRVEARKLLRRFGVEFTKKLLIFKKSFATVFKVDTEIEKLDTLIWNVKGSVEDGDCFSLGKLKVNGNDLISAGLKPGKEVAIVLEKLLDAVIVDQSLNSKEKLLNILPRFLPAF